jgi:phage FluMu protein Com
MIEFRCRGCNQKIRATDALDGKRVKCPKCGIVIVVPAVEKTGADTSQSELFFDPAFLDISQEEKTSDKSVGEDSVSEGISGEIEQFEDESEADETEQLAKRRLPWIIDIFMYPASASGLTILGIVVGVPLLIKIVTKLLNMASYRFPPLAIFALGFWLISCVVNFIIVLYMFWYFCECIRDSGRGGIRAPETMGITPGIEELVSGIARIGGCLVFFFLPLGFYYYYTREINAVFWVLLGYAAFFSPMGLLAVITLDSFSGLNPVLLISSIFKSFLPYIVLVLFFSTIGGVLSLLRPDLPQPEDFFDLLNYFTLVLRYMYTFGFICKSAPFIYLAMVGAHILGWFYRRYREKLYWEV